MSDSSEGYFSSVRTEIDPLVPKHIGNILEIGCAEGRTMAWLKSTRTVDYAAGVELVPEIGERARQVFDTVEIGPIDEIPMNFSVEQFDVIMALDVLEHLPRPHITLEKLTARLRPGGLFIASLPNVANFCVSGPLLFKGEWKYTEDGILDRTHLRFFSRAGATGMFKDLGFEIAQVETVLRYPNLFHAFGWVGASARWYSRKIFRFLPMPRHLIEFQYLIAARKPI